MEVEKQKIINILKDNYDGLTPNFNKFSSIVNLDNFLFIYSSIFNITNYDIIPFVEEI